MSRIDGENWLRLHLAARDTVRVRSLIKKYGTATELIEKDPNRLFSEGEIDEALHLVRQAWRLVKDSF